MAKTKATAPDCKAIDSSVQAKFRVARGELSGALIERGGEIDCVMTALIAKQHCLFVGKPGTGKSMLMDSVIGWMGGQSFTYLMTKYTTPEEIFGPISISGLKNDQYRRITTGKLPEADGAYLGEIWKASSAILNTMLTALNERTYDDGTGRRPIPLRLVVADSNEWPGAYEGGKELGALFDRFLIRKTVKPIASAAGRKRLLWGLNGIGASPKVKLSTTISTAEIDQAHDEARKLPWSNEAMEATETILRELKKEGIAPGDRRQYQAIGAVRAAAWLDGALEVQPDHLDILQHILWDDPADQPQKCSQIVMRIANPTAMQVSGLQAEAEQLIEETDPKDLTKASTNTKKLAEIHKKLIAVGNATANEIAAYIQEEVSRIRMESITRI